MRSSRPLRTKVLDHSQTRSDVDPALNYIDSSMPEPRARSLFGGSSASRRGGFPDEAADLTSSAKSFVPGEVKPGALAYSDIVLSGRARPRGPGEPPATSSHAIVSSQAPDPRTGRGAAPAPVDEAWIEKILPHRPTEPAEQVRSAIVSRVRHNQAAGGEREEDNRL